MAWFQVKIINRGAILASFFSFCGFCTLHFFAKDFLLRDALLTMHHHKINSSIILTMCMLLYPIFGWLADVRCGRYKMVKWTLRITFIALIFLCLVYSVLGYVSQGSSSLVLTVILYVPSTISLGGFLANVFQLGIDQLPDASSAEIVTYLRWYAWLWFLSKVIVVLSQSCLCSDYEAVGFLLLPTLAAIAVSLELVFNHWLVKEPPSANPFVLIFRVLRYAMKNKYPRLRSAFTYWDDKPYRRIDLAKTMYGGPYTTEQVEDVKTFFRVASIIVAAAVFAGMYICVYPAYEIILYHLHDDGYKEFCEYSYAYITNCFHRTVVAYSGTIVVVICVPLMEFSSCPLLVRYFHESTLKKMIVGMTLLLLSLASCAAIEFTAQYVSDQHVNATCPLTERDVSNSLSLDYRWMALPFLLNQLAQFAFLTSTAEFLCSQSPYSMRGLLFGFAYGSIGFFTIVGYFLMLPVQVIAEKILYHYGCIFWYLVLSLGIFLTTFAAFFCVFKCYRKRSRGDAEHK